MEQMKCMEEMNVTTTMIGNAARRKRQQIMSKNLSPSTEAFVGDASLRRGMNGLDLGCGTGETTLLLKSMVGNGRITGIDSRSTQISIAKDKAQRNNVNRIEFQCINILEWRPRVSYDFVYSGFHFCLLKKPLLLLKQVYSTLKPGGFAMIEDLDFSQFHSFPNSFAFDRFVELYMDVLTLQGADPKIGNNLFPLFQEVGFDHIKVQKVRPTFLTGKDKYLASFTLESIATILVNENLAMTTEIQALLFELRDFESQSNTMITLPGIYQVMGYKSS